MRRTTFTSAVTVAALAAATVVPTGNAAEIAPHQLGDDGHVVCEVKLTGKEDKQLQRFTLDASTALSSALIAVVEEQYPDVHEKATKLLDDARVRQVVEQVLRGETPASFDVVHLKSALTFNGYSAFNPSGRAVMMLYLGALVLRDDPALVPQHVLWGGEPGLIFAGDDTGTDNVVDNLLNWAFSAVPYQDGDLDNLRVALTASEELARIDAQASQYSAVFTAARNACNAQDTVRIGFPGSPRPNKPAPTTAVQTTTAPTTTVTSVVPSTTTTAEATTSKSTTSTVAPKPTTKPAPPVSSATTTATVTATETAASTVVNTTRVPVPTTVTTPVTTQATAETTTPVVTPTPTAPTTTETTETLDAQTPDTSTPQGRPAGEQPEGSSEAGKVVGIVFGVLGALGLIVAAVLAFGPDIEVKVTF